MLVSFCALAYTLVTSISYPLATRTASGCFLFFFMSISSLAILRRMNTYTCACCSFFFSQLYMVRPSPNSFYFALSRARILMGDSLCARVSNSVQIWMISILTSLALALLKINRSSGSTVFLISTIDLHISFSLAEIFYV